MEQNQKSQQRRLDAIERTARIERIFERLRQGWAYHDIAEQERLPVERVRRIVARALESRVTDTEENHARLQIERLKLALRLTGEAVERGDLRAIGPFIKVMDRLDRHQATLDRIHNRVAIVAALDRIASTVEGKKESEIQPGSWAPPRAERLH